MRRRKSFNMALKELLGHVRVEGVNANGRMLFPEPGMASRSGFRESTETGLLSLKIKAVSCYRAASDLTLTNMDLSLSAVTCAAIRTRSRVLAGHRNSRPPLPSLLVLIFVFYLGSLSFRAGAQVAYTNGFADPVGPEWSATNISVTPIGARPFLGQFISQTVTLTLTNLPAHSGVSVDFDLFSLLSWDGNDIQYGPSIWSLSVPGAGNLLRATFCANAAELGHPGIQSYPDNYTPPTFDTHPSLTGASETNTLGYVFTNSDFAPPPGVVMDAVYHIHEDFGQTNSTLQLTFAAQEGSTADDPWGLANFSVQVYSETEITNLFFAPINPLYPGNPAPFPAVLLESGVPITNLNVTVAHGTTLSSGATNIFTVSTNGNLSGISPGTATLMGTYQSLTATTAVTVLAPMSIQQSAPATLNAGGLTLTVPLLANFSVASNVDVSAFTGVTRSSSDTSIATISATGVVTPRKAGAVTLKAVYADLTNQVTINVVLPAAYVPPKLIHRYSFNETANSTVVSDSVGGANGQLVNPGFNASTNNFSGSGVLNLSGGLGGSTKAAYVNLPNGLVSGLQSVSIEGWITWNGPSSTNWERIFDFGRNLATDANGNFVEDQFNGTGASYMYMTTRATSARPRFGIKEYTGTETPSFDGTAAFPVGTQTHFAAVYDPVSGVARLYINGVRVNIASAFLPLSRVEDRNVWLGRSQFSADPFFNGQYNEFRIYSGAMLDADVAASFAAGPTNFTGVLAPQPNDNFSNAIPLTGTVVSTTGANAGATAEPGEPNHGGVSGGHSVWWNWTAPAGGPVAVDTIGSKFSTVVAIYTGTVVSNLSLVTVATNSFNPNNPASFTATAGTTYSIVVDGQLGATGAIVLNLTANMAPQIISQPQPVIASCGYNASFSVTSPGASSYQWNLNGVPITGATSSNLTVANLQYPLLGNYSVTVTNAFGQTVSSNAALTLRAPYTLVSFAGAATNAGSANGPWNQARFNQPYGMAVDNAGNIYVAEDAGDTIRKITPAGLVSTVAGLSGISGSADGVGSAARFNVPLDLCVDAFGNLYVSDTANDIIRRITPGGNVGTLAGAALAADSVDGPTNVARFNQPRGIALDAAGNLYVADFGNDTIREISSAGVVTTIAGRPGIVGTQDGIGTNALFNSPSGMTIDGAGNLYVVEVGNNTVRKIAPNGTVSTLAGLAGYAGSQDGVGSAARFRSPGGITIDASGNLYVADFQNQLLRRVTPTGVVTTLAGSAQVTGTADGTGREARMNGLLGVAADAAGNVYVSEFSNDTVRKAIPLIGVLAYSHNFESNVGSEWSTTNRSITPVGSRGFLGDFGNITDRLTLTNLPAHSLVRADFDVYALRTLDGNSTTVGPDIWRLGAVGTAQSFQTTFNNHYHGLSAAFLPSVNGSQAYPGEFVSTSSHSSFDPLTGAAETNTLGYTYSAGGTTVPFSFDSVYRLSRLFAVTNSTLQLDFSAAGLEALANESWGLDNLAVEIIDSPTNAWSLSLGTVPGLYPGDVTPTRAQFLAQPDGATNADSTVDIATLNGVTFASSDTNVFDAGTNGLMIPQSAGIASLTASYQGQSATTSVVVLAPITLTQMLPASVYAGGVVTPITLLASFSGVTNVDVSRFGGVSRTSSDPTIASIDNTGLLTPLKPGTVTLTAGYAGLSNQVVLNVVAAPGFQAGSLIHRYSFDGPPDNPLVVDSVGGANGQVVNLVPGSATNNFNGTGQLVLGGGTAGSTSAAYVNLPNGLVSSLPSVTIEAWVTWGGPSSSLWQRVFDFGRNAAVNSAGAFQEDAFGTPGIGYFFLTPYTGVSGLPRFSMTQGTNPESNFVDSPVSFPVGTEIHVAVVYDPSAGAMRFYVNGARVGSAAASLPLSVIQDLNDWLGRSQFSGDPFFAGSFDEFRIYSGALFDADIAASYRNGPENFQGVILPPGNDDFTNAYMLSGLTVYTNGSSVNATKEPGEPNHAGDPGGASVWWTWTAPQTTTMVLDTLGSSFDTLLGVYTGNSVSNLTTIASGHNPAGNQITFGAVAGTHYMIAVDGAGGTNGGVVLHLQPSVPIISVQPPPSVTVAATYPVTLTPTVTGPGLMTFQWYKNQTAISGATNISFTIAGVGTNDAAVYNVVVTGAYGVVNSSNTVLTVTTPYTFVTLAGLAGTTGTNDGVGGAARFNSPRGVTTDAAGNVYVADTLNATIRKIAPDGTVTTLAGKGGSVGITDGPSSTARFNQPFHLAVDTNGNVYVATSVSDTIRKVTPTGVVTTIAGLANNPGTADGTNNIARFATPTGIAVDPSGNLLESDSPGDTLRTITAFGTNWVVATVAGSSSNAGAADGIGTNALFADPAGLGVGTGGTVFIAEGTNDDVRQVVRNGSTWTVTHYAGASGIAGTADGQGAGARFKTPRGLSVDQFGTVYVADRDNDTIRLVTTNGVVVTIGGLTGSAGNTPGTGVVARFSSPTDVTIDSQGNIYVADQNNDVIRKGWPAFAGAPPAITVQPASQTALVGTNVTLNAAALGAGILSFQWDSNGIPVGGATNSTYTLFNAQTNYSATYSVTVSNLYGGVASSNAVLAVGLAPAISTQPLGQFITSSNPISLNVGVSGSLPLIYQWMENGTNLTDGGNLLGSATSNLVVTTALPPDSGSYSVVVTNAFGSVTSTIADVLVGFAPSITAQPSNQLVLSNAMVVFGVSASGTGPFHYQWMLNGTNPVNNIITTVAGNGTNAYAGDGGPGTNASLINPAGVAVDAAGNLFIADSGADNIRKLDPTGIITTYAGSGMLGTVLEPSGLALDRYGNLLVAGFNATRVLKVDTNGIVSSVVGNGDGGTSGDGGPATNAGVATQGGLAIDASGDLFISEEPAIRKVDTNGIITTIAGNTNDMRGYSGDGGPATSALLYNATGVAVDVSGNVFIADTGNGAIRKVDTSGIITTVAGPGTAGSLGDGGPATNSFLFPLDVAVDGRGNLFITSGDLVRRMDANGLITTVAGNGSGGYSGDGGPAINSSLSNPYGIAVDIFGDLFIADLNNHRVREVIQPDAPVLTVNNAAAANAGSYSVVVSSPYGSVTSSIANLTLIAPAAITSVPSSLTVPETATASFTAGASGTQPLSLQWFQNGILIPEATNLTLTLPHVGLGAAGSYVIVASNAGGSATSSPPAVLTVKPVSTQITGTPGLEQGVTLGDVWARSSSEAYVLGWKTRSRLSDVPDTYVYRWDGSNWTQWAAFPGHSPGRVFGTGGSDLWVTLNRCTLGPADGCGADQGGVIYRSTDGTGTNWTQQTLPPETAGQQLGTVGGTVSNIQVVVSDGSIIRFDGAAWTTIFSDPVESVNAHTMLSATEGYYVTCWGWGAWNGARWRFNGRQFDFCDVSATWALRDGNGLHWYAVGDNNGANGVRVWQFDPEAQSFDGKTNFVFADGNSPGLGTANGVWGSAADDVYVIGSLAGAGRVYHFDGTGWSQLTDFGPIPPPGGVHGTARDDVWVSLTDGRLLHVTSAVNTNDPPVITTPPQDTSLVVHHSGVLAVAAQGTPPLSYQWYFDTTNLVSGATNPVLAFDDIQPAAAGSYLVIVTNLYGSATSAPVNLTITVPPVFTLQPVGTNANLGDTVTLTAAASGATRYQWRKNGANIDDATNATYIIPDIQFDDGGSYTVVAANDAGAVSSDIATVIVTPPVLIPAADLFVKRLSFDLVDGPPVIVTGFNTNATKESGEPNHAGRLGGRSIWYTWTAPTTGVATLDTYGSTFDTLLAVYTGTVVSNLTQVAANDDDNSNDPNLVTNHFFFSKVRFNAVAGTNYQIAVDGFGGDGGYYVLTGQFQTTNNLLPDITNQPQSQVAGFGATIMLGVAVQSSNSLDYQWYFNGLAIPGAVANPLTITNLGLANVGDYSVRVTDAVTGQYADSDRAVAEISSDPGAGIVLQDKLDRLERGIKALGLRPGIKPLDAASSGDFVGFYSVSAGTVGYHVGNNVLGSTDLGEVNHGGLIGSASLYLSFQTTNTGTFVVDTHGSTIDNLFAVYQDDANYDQLDSGLLGFATNAANVQLANSVQVTNGSSGGKFLVAADGIKGQKGTIQINWSFGSEPQSSNPQPPPVQHLSAGGTITLNVGDPGLTNAAPPPVYQWYRDGQFLFQTATPVLVLTNLGATNSGTYAVVAINALGATTSAVERVIINAPVGLARGGASYGAGTFQFILTGTEGDSVLVQATTNLSSWTTLMKMPLNGYSQTMADTNAGLFGHRYYRAVQEGSLLDLESSLAVLRAGPTTNHAFSLTLPPSVEVPLVVEGSADLVHWTPLYTNPLGPGATVFIDTNTAATPTRFYRLRLTR